MPENIYSNNEIVGCIMPLLDTLRNSCATGRTLIVAMQGGQGTGKTTLARYLINKLFQEGYKAISFSIDDLYASREDRETLANTHQDNPYYQISRGMPGTHRTELLYEILEKLKNGEDVDIPVFDKSAYNGYGDISDEAVRVRGRQDIVILEGWCVEIPEATATDVIDISREYRIWEDSPLYEPQYITEVLSHINVYQKIWGLLDISIMLRPDSPQYHYKWRHEQERDLIARTGSGMTEEQVYDFVRHFLPFTYLCYERIVPDICIGIDERHHLYNKKAP